MSKLRLISDQKDWDRVADRLRGEPELALDTESNSLYCYQERICLIQIGAGPDVFLVDPLATPDLSALGELTADASVVKALHGSDYDLRCLDRDYSFQVRSLFDTETAARFLGVASPNLGAVLEQFLSVAIPKSRKLQRSNWGLRPLPPLALEYAAGDVRYLAPLTAELRRRLEEARRYDWVMEECVRMEQARYLPSEPPEKAFLRVKGSERLSPRELATLKELFLFRDRQAKRRDCPPFRILDNNSLIALAQAGSRSLRDLPGLNPRVVEIFGAQLREAIQRGQHSPEVVRPDRRLRGNPWSSESQDRLRRLKGWRTERGTALALDPALLWPAASLERLALDPDSRRTELAPNGAAEVREWQRREFSEDLARFLEACG